MALALVLALGLLGIMYNVAHAQGSNPYPYGRSTHWAWQNRPDLPPDLGEAMHWDDKAAARGWPVTAYPRHMSIAVFEPGVQGAGPAGHVAVVEQVHSDGTYLTSQMDEADCRQGGQACGRVVRRVYSMGTGVSFIHYRKDTRTTWGFAGGAAGWTPMDLGEGRNAGSGWYYPITGADPRLISPELDVPLHSYNTIEIEMATDASVTDPTIQVYFATSEQPDFSEGRSMRVSATADGRAHLYRVYFSGWPGWQGRLARLRLDPAGPGTIGNTGGVRVERIRLVSLPVEPQTGLPTTLAKKEPSRTPASDHGFCFTGR
jgi:surface antigen